MFSESAKYYPDVALITPLRLKKILSSCFCWNWEGAGSLRLPHLFMAKVRLELKRSCFTVNLFLMIVKVWCLVLSNKHDEGMCLGGLIWAPAFCSFLSLPFLFGSPNFTVKPDLIEDWVAVVVWQLKKTTGWAKSAPPEASKDEQSSALVPLEALLRPAKTMHGLGGPQNGHLCPKTHNFQFLKLQLSF